MINLSEVNRRSGPRKRFRREGDDHDRFR